MVDQGGIMGTVLTKQLKEDKWETKGSLVEVTLRPDIRRVS